MRAITDWLTRNREAAATTWAARHRFLLVLPTDHPHRHAFIEHAAKARRRLARWDRALDWWTKDGTRH